jgi:hypothetical protein
MRKVQLQDSRAAVFSPRLRMYVPYCTCVPLSPLGGQQRGKRVPYRLQDKHQPDSSTIFLKKIQYVCTNICGLFTDKDGNPYGKESVAHDDATVSQCHLVILPPIGIKFR